MPTRTAEYDHFIYILYDKKETSDYHELKDVLKKYVSSYNGEKDFIIDLTRCKGLNSMEIGIIAKVLTRLEESKRYLRLITSDAIERSFDDLGLFMKKHVVHYANTQSFAEELRRFKGRPLPAGPGALKTIEIPLYGDLAGVKTEEMTNLVTRALQGDYTQVVLDLTKVDFIDSLCIGQLMYLDGKAKDIDKYLVLSGPQDHIMKVFRDTSLDKILNISTD